MTEGAGNMGMGGMELEQQEGQLYGKEWRVLGSAIGRMKDELRSMEAQLPVEDVVIVKSVVGLLEWVRVRDRLGFFHKDLKLIVEELEAGRLDRGVAQERMRLIQGVYGVNDEEAVLEVRKSQLAKMGIAAIPVPLTRFDWPRKNNLSIRLYKFSDVKVVIEPNGVEIALDPVYDGGVDSVAYPVRRAKIKVVKDKGLELKLNISFSRHHPWEEELARHQEVQNFMKLDFARVVDAYTRDHNAFTGAREWDGNSGDESQVAPNLMEFIVEDYLKRRLEKSEYKKFRSALKFCDSDNILAAVGMYTVTRELLDRASHTWKGWFAGNAAGVLYEVTRRIGTGLERMGYRLEGDAESCDAIIRRAISDSGFAKRLNRMWGEAFRFKEEQDATHADMLRDELEGDANRYRLDLYREILKGALESARGVITVKRGGWIFSLGRD